MLDEDKLEIQEGIIGNDDPDSQEDYYQNSIQQHNNNVKHNGESVSTILRRSIRRITNPIVTLSNSVRPKIQECERQKKKNKVHINSQNTVVEYELDEDPLAVDNNKPIVELNIDDVTEGDAEDINAPCELESDPGPYWALAQSAQSAQAYVLNTIASYSNIEASKSTPQYGFNRGLKEFGSLGYEATVKELDDNLLRMGAVSMLSLSDVNKKIRYEALNYLMFLKRKRCGKVKARGCTDGRPQREYISKDESSSPTVSIYALMT
jgi:hypothetical protein